MRNTARILETRNQCYKILTGKSEGTIKLESLKCRWKDKRNSLRACELDSICLGQGPVVGSC
jgi:hypothetical protein